jgi:hypothetical protein
MQYDTAPLTIRTSFIAWRVLTRRTTLKRAILILCSLLATLNLDVVQGLDACEQAEGILLPILFLAGTWNSLPPMHTPPNSQRETVVNSQ